MALNVRTQVVASVTDTAAGISIAQQHTFDDLATSTLSLNTEVGTYILPATSTWVKVNKGDIGVLRDIYLVLTSTPEDAGIGVLITTSATPNTAPDDPTFLMRQTFVATTKILATYNVWIKNFGTAVASVTAVLGGENV
jgi:hypothetical protein